MFGRKRIVVQTFSLGVSEISTVCLFVMPWFVKDGQGSIAEKDMN
jgi:hypothetical protein